MTQDRLPAACLDILDATAPHGPWQSRPFLRTPEEGADTIVWLATATEAAKASGEFWLDRQPHPTHILSRTKERAGDKRKLLDALAEFATKFS